ncbi:hypothetical protein P3S67_004411 [Capsicum chacoense]
MANSSLPLDTDNSTAGDIPDSYLVGEASENNCTGEEEPMPPVAGEEEVAEEGSADADGDGDSDAEDDSDLVGEAADDDEASEDIDDSDDEEEPLSPMTVEEEEGEEMNQEPEEIMMEIPVDEGITDSDGKGDAEAAEPQERVEATKDVHTITELIRPVSYAATFVNDRQDDVSITFLAKRSDGKETLVDNKFLKINNPFLLIDFYEQIVRFINPPK